MRRSRTGEHARPPAAGASGIRERPLAGVPVGERRLVPGRHLRPGPLLGEPRYALAMLAFAARPTEGTQERLFRQCVVDLDGLREQLGERGQLLEAYALDRARQPAINAALKHLMPQLGVRAIPPPELVRIAVPTTPIWGRHDRQVRVAFGSA